MVAQKRFCQLCLKSAVMLSLLKACGVNGAQTNYKKKTLQCSNGLIQSLTQQPNIADVANFVQLGKCKVKFKASVYMLVNCGDQ